MENPAKILIVDDDILIINIILSILKQNDYETDYCFSGEQALEKVQENDYDLVLLDVSMGKGMDGYQTCQLLTKSQKDVPVILVTAIHDDESVNLGFESGSSDYIKKPVSRLELLARVHNIITYKRAEKKNLQLIEELKKDLNTAANIQQAMLPKWVYLDRKILISSYYEPSEAVGGDLFDQVKLNDNKYVLYIGDISGHGVQAALLMTAVKSTIRLMVEAYQDEWDMPLLFNKLNERFYEELSLRSNYLTLLMVVVDLEEREFRFLNAGHPPLLRIDKQAREVSILDKKGSLPLGWLKEPAYSLSDIERLPISTNDSYLLYTDGIYEAENDAGESFGIDGLIKFLSKNALTKINLNLPFIILEHLSSRGYKTQADDFTLLSFQVLDHEELHKKPIDNQTHHTLLRASLKNVGRVAQDCDKFVLKWTTDALLAAKAELIVAEFLNNIISYGYNYQEDADIVIGIRLSPQTLSIRFWDKGIFWQPNLSELKKEKDLHSLGGRGMQMILSLSTRFQRRRFKYLNETTVELDL